MWGPRWELMQCTRFLFVEVYVRAMAVEKRKVGALRRKWEVELA